MIVQSSLVTSATPIENYTCWRGGPYMGTVLVSSASPLSKIKALVEALCLQLGGALKSVPGSLVYPVIIIWYYTLRFVGGMQWLSV